MTILQTNDLSQNIPSFGVDSDPESRPGVPMELDPTPKVGAKRPSQQQTVIGITGTRLPGQRLTPVYGSAHPPRGLAPAPGGRPDRRHRAQPAATRRSRPGRGGGLSRVVSR